MYKRTIMISFIFIISIFIFILLKFIFTSSNPNPSLSPQVISKKIEENKISLKQNLNKESSKNKKSEFYKPNFIDYKSKYGELPSSLRDTEVDGGLEIDDRGNLIINKTIRYFFEYFLSAIGEEPLEIIKGRIEEYIQNKLPKEASKEALDIFNSYFKYKKSLEELEKSNNFVDSKNNTDKLSKILEQRINVRRTTMSPKVVEAFFTDEEAYDNFSIKRMNILEDKALSNEEKMIKVSQLENDLPDFYKADQKIEKDRIELEKETIKLREKGASIEEIQDLRTKFLGHEAAERLLKLDMERAEWQRKINEFLKTKKELLENKEISEEEKNIKINQIKQNLFSDSETKRVDAIEKGYVKF